MQCRWVKLKVEMRYYFVLVKSVLVLLSMLAMLYSAALQWVLLRCMFHHSHDYYDMRFEIIIIVQLTTVDKLTKLKKMPEP